MVFNDKYLAKLIWTSILKNDIAIWMEALFEKQKNWIENLILLIGRIFGYFIFYNL